MARFGLIGDLHGNHRWASRVLGEFGKRNIQHAFVLGDFGLWGGFAGVQYLDRLQEAATFNNLSVLAIPGNHDNYDILEHYQEHAPTSKGFYYLRERVLMSPKVNSFKMFGKQFLVAGGAVSIDKDWRLAKERGGNWSDPETGWCYENGRGVGARTLWWPQEQLTEGEVDQAKSYGKADILLTHDCSDRTPFGQRLKPDMDSQMHRQKIDSILRSVKPDWHFHGHMHEMYEWDNLTGDDHYTATRGLHCDPEASRGNNIGSWGVFDTDTNEFSFEGRGMQFRSLED